MLSIFFKKKLVLYNFSIGWVLGIDNWKVYPFVPYFVTKIEITWKYKRFGSCKINYLFM